MKSKNTFPPICRIEFPEPVDELGEASSAFRSPTFKKFHQLHVEVTNINLADGYFELICVVSLFQGQIIQKAKPDLTSLRYNKLF